MEHILQTVRIAKIRLLFSISLKKCGGILSDRLNMKILFGLSSIPSNVKDAAINKSLKTINPFLIALKEVSSIRKAVFDHNKHITTMQKKWKRICQHNNIRKSLMKRRWNEVIEKLIKEYTKDKKQVRLVKKLKELMNETQELNKYYNEQKAKYDIILTMWLENYVLLYINNNRINITKEEYHGLVIYQM